MKISINEALKRGEMMGIGKRIAEVRKGKFLTQEFLAQRLSKTPQWLSNIERGTRPISADKLVNIACILGVDPSIFFENQLNESSKPIPRAKGKEAV